jgi:hypothetical protein
MTDRRDYEPPANNSQNTEVDQDKERIKSKAMDLFFIGLVGLFDLAIFKDDPTIRFTLMAGLGALYGMVEASKAGIQGETAKEKTLDILKKAAPGLLIGLSGAMFPELSKFAFKDVPAALTSPTALEVYKAGAAGVTAVAGGYGLQLGGKRLYAGGQEAYRGLQRRRAETAMRSRAWFEKVRNDIKKSIADMKTDFGQSLKDMKQNVRDNISNITSIRPQLPFELKVERRSMFTTTQEIEERERAKAEAKQKPPTLPEE